MSRNRWSQFSGARVAALAVCGVLASVSNGCNAILGNEPFQYEAKSVDVSGDASVVPEAGADANQDGGSIPPGPVVPTGDFIRAVRFGADKDDVASAVAFDSRGHLVVVGNFQSAEVDFGNGKKLSSLGASDGFIAKYDETGKCLWAVGLRGTGEERLHAVKIGEADAIFIAGAASSANLDLGGSPVPSNANGAGLNLVVAKLAADGQKEWAISRGAPSGSEEALALAVDRAGNVGVGGAFFKTNEDLSFGDGVIADAPVSATPRHMGFAALFGPSGVAQWARVFVVPDQSYTSLDNTTTSYWAQTIGVVFDAVGDLVASGSFGVNQRGIGALTNPASSKVNLDYPNAQTWVSPDSRGAFVIKLERRLGGKLSWANAPGTDRTPQDEPPGWSLESKALALDADGTALVGVQFAGAMQLPGVPPLRSVGRTDIALLQVDIASGKVIGVRSFGSAGDDDLAAIAAGGAGELVVTGSLGASADLGRGLIPSAGGSDAFVARLDSSLNVVWAHSFGGPGEDGARAAVMDGKRGAAFVGSFSDTALFARESLISAGARDGFVAWLKP